MALPAAELVIPGSAEREELHGSRPGTQFSEVLTRFWQLQYQLVLGSECVWVEGLAEGPGRQAEDSQRDAATSLACSKAWALCTPLPASQPALEKEDPKEASSPGRGLRGHSHPARPRLAPKLRFGQSTHAAPGRHPARDRTPLQGRPNETGCTCSSPHPSEWDCLERRPLKRCLGSNEVPREAQVQGDWGPYERTSGHRYVRGMTT